MANNLTVVRLLAVPLENDYIHTLYFETEQAQRTYFQGKTVKSASELTYQRKDKVIRYPAHVDTLIGCNYVMYQNPNNTSKWFYAFITKMEYVNDERTDIFIETDVIQTWFFAYTVKPSFVEREHVSDDTIGVHTVPEQLELGEYKVNNVNKNKSLLSPIIIVGSTVNLDASTGTFGEDVAGGYYNGVYSGVRYYWGTEAEVNSALESIAEAGKSDSIVAVFQAPTFFVDRSSNPDGISSLATGMDVISRTWNSVLGTSDVNNVKPTTIDGYTPKNKKLFTYPYCYMLMSNGSGGNAIYHYEKFNNPDNPNLCDFYIKSAVTPSMSITLIPRYYNGATENEVERLNLGKFPICAWSSDVYTNWLTQNGVNIGVSIASDVIKTGLGIAGALVSPTTGGLTAVAGAGAIASGVSGITSTIGEIYQHSLQPPQAEGNVNSGDITYSAKMLTFTAYTMTVKQEYAKIIDNFFNMFGYKVSTVKIPNVAHRQNYWYIKTIDVNIDGNIPVEDIQRIKACYNRGVTFWRNPSAIGNYQVSNNIV